MFQKNTSEVKSNFRLFGKTSWKSNLQTLVVNGFRNYSTAYSTIILTFLVLNIFLGLEGLCWNAPKLSAYGRHLRGHRKTRLPIIRKGLLFQFQYHQYKILLVLLSPQNWRTGNATVCVNLFFVWIEFWQRKNEGGLINLI